MGEGKAALSVRLEMLARMVTPGNIVADVGCDHGFLSIYLVKEGVSPSAIAMDLRRGPLSAAGKHIEEQGLGSYIETRISDGLHMLHPGEAQTLVCAGMGGRLMEKILSESMEKARAFRELILQPQSELAAFRAFLRRAGFQTAGEDMVLEDGKYYFAMRAVPGRGNDGERIRELAERAALDPETFLRLCDRFGEGLLAAPHPLMEQYLRGRKELLRGLARELAGRRTDRVRERLSRIGEELSDVDLALRLCQAG